MIAITPLTPAGHGDSTGVVYVAVRCASCGPHPLIEPVQRRAGPTRNKVGDPCRWSDDHWGLTLEELREEVAEHVSERGHRHYLHHDYALTWAAVTGAPWPGCASHCDQVPVRPAAADIDEGDMFWNRPADPR